MGVFSGLSGWRQDAKLRKVTWNYAGTGGGDAAIQASAKRSHPLPSCRKTVDSTEYTAPQLRFQLQRRKHYSRYTRKWSSAFTWIPKNNSQSRDLYTAFAKTADMKKVGHDPFTPSDGRNRPLARNHTPPQRWLANAYRQRGKGGGRGQRLARALQHSGRHGHGRYLDIARPI